MYSWHYQRRATKLRLLSNVDYRVNVFLQKARIICCTCCTAGSGLFKNMEFAHAIIDEAGQGTEPDLLTPLGNMGIGKLTLIGDHKQVVHTFAQPYMYIRGGGIRG